MLSVLSAVLQVACAATDQLKTNSQQFILHSQSNQRDYAIQIYVPEQPAPKAGFAVLYLLDGDAIFDSAKQMSQFLAKPNQAQADMQPVVIVAIGYPHAEMGFDKKQRAFDFTPTPIAAQQQAARVEYGGAAAFATFIEKELKPVVQEKVTINTQQQAIYGHSLGGLFVVNLFLKHPQSFQKFIAASPSIWFNQFQLVQEQSTWLKQHPSSDAMLMLSYGSNEGLGPSQVSAQQMSSYKKQFFGRFAARHAQQTVWVYQHPSEQHLSNFYASLPKAILLASCPNRIRCKALLD
ncbi:alpha/beta hydrolase [Acinetobacter sp. MD2(2019)]|uniref:alpha/beta hydrolase n=1 Tax=Acinetobacter sp. MD2(2019) TaxID=2605273 RepID=UPI002D1F2532|nr:alpha/beta hydrolase-fold protein [Acinetobacter sp. MD2(2019)]MEB3754099.1 alpha/beta hydrolase [Acinetobacter sp. MD2(2019)]